MEQTDDSTPSVMLASALQKYPQLKDMDPRHAAIVLLFAAGLPAPSIAEYCKCSRACVYKVVNQYKVSEDIHEGLELQKLILVSSLGSLAVQAAGNLHAKRDEMNGMNLKQTLGVLTDVMKLIESLNITIEKPKKAEGSLVEDIQARLTQ